MRKLVLRSSVVQCEILIPHVLFGQARSRFGPNRS
jgi:hypothetical protein